MKSLLKKLRKLNLPRDKFAIFGSGPLGIRGLRRIKDLDLVVLPELWNELKQQYPVVKKELGESVNLSENIEAITALRFGFNPQRVIEEADIIDGIRCVNLKTIIEWKRKMGRKKDLEDIKLIKDYLEKGGP